MISAIKSTVEEKVHYHNELIDKITNMMERKKNFETKLALCRVEADILRSESMSKLFKENEIQEMKDELDEKVKRLCDEENMMIAEMDMMVFQVKVLEKELIPDQLKSKLRSLPFEKYSYKSSKFYLKRAINKNFFDELNE